ncbi:MAG: UDP-N-acetylmuramate dehydrogenase, partial [bacterium]|nr:UDP-N-acetylmuramate dehydrogenase [bacterium]
MNVQEHVPLAPFTTLNIGGSARFFIEARTEEEIQEAFAYARERNLPLFFLGAGSNLLVPDTSVEGVVLKIALHSVAFENNGDETLLIAGAGTPWEEIVDAASERELFGIENLAGIPGTMGGAAVQNIGAYGAELADIFAYADVIDTATGIHRRIEQAEAAFSYRTSFFKMHRELVVVRVALHLSKRGTPNIAYPDLALALRSLGEAGRASKASLTPTEIVSAIRTIRAQKFPCASEGGTAGSFFKNPIVDEKTLTRLRTQY